MHQPTLQELLHDPEKLNNIIGSTLLVAGMFAGAYIHGLRKSLKEQRADRAILESELEREYAEIHESYELISSRIVLAKAVSDPRILGSEEDRLRFALEEQKYYDELEVYKNKVKGLAERFLLYPVFKRVQMELKSFDASLRDLYSTTSALSCQTA